MTHTQGVGNHRGFVLMRVRQISKSCEANVRRNKLVANSRRDSRERPAKSQASIMGDMADDALEVMMDCDELQQRLADVPPWEMSDDEREFMYDYDDTVRPRVFDRPPKGRTMPNELATVDRKDYLPVSTAAVDAVMQRLTVIQDLMKRAMTLGVDYGVVPGTNSKPTLLKPGAEKLGVMFQLAPKYTTAKTWGDGGHLTVESTCEISDMRGNFLGEASAMCSTRESKYAWRRAERQCPQCGKATVFKSKKEGEGFYCWRKKDGCGATFDADDQAITSQVTGRVANPDLPDIYNTVLRIAEKRCLSGGVPLLIKTERAISRSDVEGLYEIWKAGKKAAWLPGVGGDWRKVEAVEKIGKRPVKAVTLSDGSVIRVTAEHRFPTTCGLVDVSCLKAGDRLLRSKPVIADGEADLDFGYIVGLYIAEGHFYNNDNAVRFTLHADEVGLADRIQKVASRLGAGFSVRPRSKGRVMDVNVYGKSFAGLMKHFVAGNLCHGKHLSRNSWSQGPAFIKQILGGFLDGDGYLTTDKQGNASEFWQFGFSGENADLFKDLRTACNLLGYQMRGTRGKATAGGKTFPAYRGQIRTDRPEEQSKYDRCRETVMKIEDDGDKVVYDIQVDGDHLFLLADGIQTHNSFIAAVRLVTGASSLFDEEIPEHEAEPRHEPERDIDGVISGMGHAPKAESESNQSAEAQAKFWAAHVAHDPLDAFNALFARTKVAEFGCPPIVKAAINDGAAKRGWAYDAATKAFVVRSQPVQCITGEQCIDLAGLLDRAGTPVEDFLKDYQIKAIGELPAVHWQAAKGMLEGMIQNRQAKK